MARAWVEHVRRPPSSDAVIATIERDYPVPFDEQNIPHDWFTLAQERRAALNLHAFTGLVPQRMDDGRRHGTVDMVLHAENLKLAVEVTSSASNRDEKVFDRSERLVRRINVLYRGPSHWALHFGKGFAPPSNTRRTQDFAASVVNDLRDLDRLGAPCAPLPTAQWMLARRIDDGRRAFVEGVSWDSRVPPSDASYIDELRAFLGSPLILSKRRKLIAEGQRLDAGGRHLYLYVTPTGANAHIFPRQAWLLAGPPVELPEGIDVLWIDTRGALTYRYSDADGVAVLRN